jgi:hypothetical protein
LRLIVAGVWIFAQIALVLTANRRDDGAFGFRPLAESSTVRVSLYREVFAGGDAARQERAPGGVWFARDAGGLVRRFSWRDRVSRPELATFDTEIRTPNGTKAFVSALESALHDVATHVPDDAETHRLFVEVTIRRNGREPYNVRLFSAARPGAL